MTVGLSVLSGAHNTCQRLLELLKEKGARHPLFLRGIIPAMTSGPSMPWACEGVFTRHVDQVLVRFSFWTISAPAV